MLMRLLLVLLLVLNGGYWLYHWRMAPAQEPGAVAPAPLALAPGVAPLQRLSERPPPERVERHAAAPASEPVVRSCLFLGPLPEAVAGRQVRDRLLALDFSADLYRASVPAAPDYWVHVPPLPSRQEALAQLRALQAEGVESFVITEGELANGISLGLFSRREAAMGLAAARRAGGVAVDVREVARRLSQIWVVLEQVRPGEVSEELLQRLRQGIPDLENHLGDCEVIAGWEKLE